MKYTQEQINENRAKWLARLRNPKSKRQAGLLENPNNKNRRCCLGHACAALKIERYQKAASIYYDEEMYYLPAEACRKLNIDKVGNLKKRIKIRGIEFEQLAHINDQTNFDPSEMADLIEQQFEADNFAPHHPSGYA